MNKISTSVVPSYLAWVLVFTAISICVLPISIVIGSITSTSNFAINITGKFICPADTVPKSYSYATTVENKDGKLVTAPSTSPIHVVIASNTLVQMANSSTLGAPSLIAKTQPAKLPAAQ